MYVWSEGKSKWMEPREHLTKKFRQEYLDRIAIELKELELLGWSNEYFGGGIQEVFAVTNGKTRYVVHVNRKGQILGWTLVKYVDGVRRAILQWKTFDCVWDRIRGDILSDV